jgi:hypothetical protein
MDQLFYKVSVRGIVYLINPVTSKVYTYDLSDPTEIGKMIWTNPKAEPTIEFLDNYMDVLTHKLESVTTG